MGISSSASSTTKSRTTGHDSRLGSARRPRRFALATLVAACALWGRFSPATAAIYEPNNVAAKPNGLQIPISVSNGEIKLSTLFGSTMQNEAIDWFADAAVSPGVFSPLCGFTATFVLKQSGGQSGFGWYNVDANRTTAPTSSDIHLIVPSSAGVGYQFSGTDITKDVAYAGGLVGFALIQNQLHFSEPKWNVLCSSSTSCNPSGNWITSLTYKSVNFPNAYYLAWEDGGLSSSTFGNDGDFNDKVFLIKGITCAGGGTSCDTGLKGVCAAGVNQCSKAGGVTCAQKTLSSAELCDGLDNDCDGTIDDGNLCAQGEVCDRGHCVPFCVEQGCAAGQVCTAQGMCNEPACKDVVCPDGQRCSGGTCRSPCQGVVCPGGQECRAGACLDKCQGIVCDSGFSCFDGVCQVACQCRACASGYTCQASGSCLVSACDGKVCSTGQHCEAVAGVGTCVDSCQNVVCPSGQSCKAGKCADPCQGVSCTSSQVCCPVGASCTPGTCLDKCDPSLVTCQKGFSCSAGKCVDACLVLSCGSGQFCQLGQCVDPCAGVQCGSGEICSYGTCHNPCDSVSCTTGTKCSAGACVDACQGVTCSNGGTCVNGACGAGCTGVQCASGEICKSGVCMSLCAGVSCASGQKCQAGSCVDACQGVSCSSGSKCVAGTCVDACKGVSCAATEACVGGTCVDSCNAVVCGTGQICRPGTGICVAGAGGTDGAGGVAGAGGKGGGAGAGAASGGAGGASNMGGVGGGHLAGNAGAPTGGSGGVASVGGMSGSDEGGAGGRGSGGVVSGGVGGDSPPLGGLTGAEHDAGASGGATGGSVVADGSADVRATGGGTGGPGNAAQGGCSCSVETQSNSAWSVLGVAFVLGGACRRRRRRS